MEVESVPEPTPDTSAQERHRLLQSLLDRVEAAAGADREIDLAFQLIGWPGTTEAYWLTDELDRREFGSQWKFTASLDAALALCERVLPGWTMVMDGSAPDLGTDWELFQPNPPLGEVKARIMGTHNDRTLALLAAMLKALIAKETP